MDHLADKCHFPPLLWPLGGLSMVWKSCSWRLGALRKRAGYQPFVLCLVWEDLQGLGRITRGVLSAQAAFNPQARHQHWQHQHCATKQHVSKQVRTATNNSSVREIGKSNIIRYVNVWLEDGYHMVALQTNCLEWIGASCLKCIEWIRRKAKIR